MADDINKNISIDVQVNTDGQQQIDQYRQSFDSLRSSIGNLGKPITDLTNGLNTLTKNIAEATNTLSKFADQGKDTSSTGGGLKGMLGDLSTTFGSLKNVLKGSMASLAEWGAALSDGLTLIIQYGPQIVNWVSSLLKGKDALDKAKLGTQALNDALQSTDYSKAVKQLNELKINVDLAKKGFVDKTSVVKQYNETLGATMGRVSDLNSVETKLIKNGDAYVKMTLYKAAAEIALQDAAKKAYEAKQAQLKSDDDSLTFWDKMVDISNQSGGISAPGAVPNAGFAQNHENAAKLRKQMAEKNRQEAISDANKQADAFLSIAKNFQQQAAEISKKSHFDFFSGEITTSGSQNANTDQLQGLSEAEKMRADSLIRQLQATNQLYSAAALAENQRFSQEKERLKKLLDDKLISRREYNKVAEQLEAEHAANMAGILKTYKDQDQSQTRDTQAELVGISMGVKDITSSLSETNVVSVDLLKNLGSVKDLVKKDDDKRRQNNAKEEAQQRKDFEIQTTQKISDTAFSIIEKGIQAQSEAKIKALEGDKSRELSNTSLTATQRQAIEAKYKKQEDAIKLKAFKDEQKASVAQAIINGALAVTKAEAQTGVLGEFAIPAIIAQTAIQVATIVAQKPPAMAKGGYFASDGRGALLPGYSRADNTNAYLRSGEAVVVSEAMRDPWARNLVSAINVAYGGRDFSVPNTSRGYAVGGIFTDGGNANRYYNQPMNDQKNLANTIAYQMINNFPPVYVDVKDINNQQNILAQTINRVNL